MAEALQIKTLLSDVVRKKLFNRQPFENRNADLIVMGPHSTRAQEKKVVRVAGKIGNSVEEVIMREKCPVIVLTDPVALKPWEDTLNLSAIGDPDAGRTLHVFNKKQKKS